MNTKKVTLFGRDSNSIRSLVERAGFLITDNNHPDFVISYGGDGTLMGSEFKYPSIPKIILKGSLICKKAYSYSNEDALKKIQGGNYKIEKIEKILARTKSRELVALNDIVVHNKNPRHAIRYTLFINNKQINKEIIGDGIVVSTPFGSTGYYRSITDSFFETGIGLAFNNSTEQSDHMVLKEENIITLHVTRGPAMIYADNQEEEIELLDNEEVTIKLSEQFAHIVTPID
ncbi:hypothetical protein C4565_03120 [Candidatus Parcubacteria bacterium]|jgi:NAD+ kinase|nr:MAG: hypothetical protein C4565_03120 [Candidatus Parcubacteria bacterium]